MSSFPLTSSHAERPVDPSTSVLARPDRVSAEDLRGWRRVDGPPDGPRRSVRPSTGRGIHDLFARQAARTPTAIALEFEGTELSYRALEARANRLAHWLQGAGVGPDRRVAIFLERSVSFVVAILATLKAGGAYVPLDPAYPAERLQMMLEEAGPTVLLAQSSLSDRLTAPEGCSVLSLDTDLSLVDAQPDTTPPSATTPDHLAYVLFTSGSTGRPKGVAMPHGPLVRLIEWQCRRSALGVGDRTLQFSALSFDVSFQEIFSTWCSGGRLVLVSEATRRDAVSLLRLMEERQIQRLFLPFVALQHIADIAQAKDRYPSSLREVITAGEQLKIVPSLQAFFRRCPDCSLENQYGPTETHVVTAYRLPADVATWATLPSIGRPIPSARIYLLDEALQPVPEGTPGELYVGGDCLAREYFNQPDQTAERFRPDPFRAVPGARMYRTGDLARSQPDGTLDFLGRADDQVKVRGYRVELGEIEAVLAEHDSVREAVVVPDQGQAQGNQRLTAVLILQPDAGLNPEALRAHVSGRLPDYMVPAAFDAVDTFPLTPSGKVDRRALASRPPRAPSQSRTVTPPRNDLERVLVELWEKALNVRPIGIRDDFSSLGGHSILAAEMLVELSSIIGRDLPLSLLADTPTIEALAHKLQSGQDQAGWSILVPIRPQGRKSPLFCVHGGGRHILRFGALAQLLPADQPVYGLQWAGLNGAEVPSSIESVAELYLASIQAVQPTGPYLLAGHCYGSIVAYEMARRLQEEGERVELLAMMDPAGIGPRAEPMPSAVRELRSLLSETGVTFKDGLQRLKTLLALRTRIAVLRALLGGSPLPASLRSQMRTLPGMAEMYRAFGRKLPVEIQERYARQVMIRALRQYRAAPLTVPTLVLHRGPEAEFSPPATDSENDLSTYQIDTNDHDAIVHHPDTVRHLTSHLAAAHRRIGERPVRSDV